MSDENERSVASAGSVATLTGEELDAIEHGLERLELHSDTESRESAATLRNLLNRLGGEK